MLYFANLIVNEIEVAILWLARNLNQLKKHCESNVLYDLPNRSSHTKMDIPIPGKTCIMNVDELIEPLIWVDSQNALEMMVKDLLTQDFVAVDTESNSLFVYQEQVCLIQFSTGKVDYLVDPLALSDISVLASVFENGMIEKIFHAAEYDLIVMKRDYEFQFQNIFDTMVAGRILGKKALGLGGMLKAEYGIELNKRYQRANWGKRPLPQAQLNYARLDSHYLISLRELLFSELERANLSELAQEDFLRLCNVRIPESYHINSENGWRFVGGQHLSPSEMAVLYELYLYRDREARKANLPPFKIISEQALREIALACPRVKHEVFQVPTLSERLARRHGHGIVQAVQRGLKSDPPPRPPRLEHHEGFMERNDALRLWRKQTGQSLGVESDVVLPRDILEELARKNPSTMVDLSVEMQQVPWRYKRYGRRILHVLQAAA